MAFLRQGAFEAYIPIDATWSVERPMEAFTGYAILDLDGDGILNLIVNGRPYITSENMVALIFSYDEATRSVNYVYTLYHWYEPGWLLRYSEEHNALVLGAPMSTQVNTPDLAFGSWNFFTLEDLISRSGLSFSILAHAAGFERAQGGNEEISEAEFQAYLSEAATIVFLDISSIDADRSRTAQEDERWRVAYRDFMLQTHTWYDPTDRFQWGIEQIVYAELIDFNGDGVPELLFIIEMPLDMQGAAATWYPVFVVGYRGTAEVLYIGTMIGHGRRLDQYGFARTLDGRHYLFSTSDVADFEVLASGATHEIIYLERTYFTLEGNVFAPVLTTRNLDNGRYFFVNDERVSESDYQNAAFEHLGIIAHTDLWDFRVSHPGATGHALLAELGHRVDPNA